MSSFTDLEVWKIALSLTKEVYRLTKKFPAEELYGLTAQIRRSSISVLANIAEGFSKYTFADKAARFIIARGEASETKALLIVISELGLVSSDETIQALDLVEMTGRLLSGLIRSCRKRS